MTIYIILDDGPGEWCDNSSAIIGVYLKKSTATREMKLLKKKNAYVYQYLKVIKQPVIIK